METSGNVTGWDLGRLVVVRVGKDLGFSLNGKDETVVDEIIGPGVERTMSGLGGVWSGMAICGLDLGGSMNL